MINFVYERGVGEKEGKDVVLLGWMKEQVNE